MRLYLVQHGSARPKEEDPERPLTEGGAAEVVRVAAHLAARYPRSLVRIVHSGKTRARQTAELLAERFADATVEEAEGLAPMDDAEVWAEPLAEEETDGTVLVGHLPHLSRLAGLLLAGDADRAVVGFRNAGIVCLERDGDGAWSLRWVLVPELC